MAGIVTVKIDTSGLNRGIEAASRYSKRTVPQLVNTALYWVAVNAKNATRFVTPETIDTQLALIKTPIIGKRGQALKGKHTLKAISNVTVTGKSRAGKTAPLAALIIAARTRPDSIYNQKTKGRYLLPSHPFKGLTRGLIRQKMAALIDRMAKARHSSGKFLLAGWIPAIRQLKPYTAQKFMRGVSANQDQRAYHGASLGSATIANEGWQVSGAIENDIGLSGINRESMNRALLAYGSRPLQEAVDREGKRQMEYSMKKMEEELAKEVSPHWS